MKKIVGLFGFVFVVAAVIFLADRLSQGVSPSAEALDLFAPLNSTPAPNVAPMGSTLTVTEMSTLFPAPPPKYGKTCKEARVYGMPNLDEKNYIYTIPIGAELVPIYAIYGEWVMIYPNQPGVQDQYILANTLCQ